MSKKNFHIGVVLTVLATIIAGCSNNSTEDEPQIFERPVYKQISLTTRQSEGVEMNNEFAFKMFKDINTNPDHSNLDNKIFSPFSLFSLFSMLANGDEEDTASIILRALSGEKSKLTKEELNTLNALLLQELPSVDPTTNVAISNSLWMNNQYTFYPEFTTSLSDSYGAELFSCDFDNHLRNNINFWVEQHTNGVIKNFLENKDMGNNIFYNVNTAYFKGAWTVPFPFENTKTGIFHSKNGDTKVNMMNVESTFQWGAGEKERVIRIPYGSENYEMVVMIPNENVNIDEYIASLSDKYLSDIPYCVDNVSLTIPKFNLENKMMLYREDFISTGLEKLFHDGTFSKICKEMNPSFDYVRTATKIIIDESGTEGGAASTAAIDWWNPNLESKVFQFTIDRPFIFIIRETSTNAILFIGKIGQL